MKHTVGEVSKQLSSDKKFQSTSSMEMIDVLFTDKSQDFPYFQSVAVFCVRCLLTGCFCNLVKTLWGIGFLKTFHTLEKQLMCCQVV